MAPTVPIDFSGQRESKGCLASQLMGKSKKFSSKGISAGFMPDFRHAVETMAESEGFGSSGRVDTEITASDDSFAPKRKCISLNADGSNNLGIPLQVLSLTKMPGPERKELKMRLKKELAQIKSLQCRIASFTSEVIAQSPCSDIHSWSDGQKKLHLESSGVSAQNGSAKKRTVSSHKASRSSKKGSTRHQEYTKLAAPGGASSSDWLKHCETLLNRLMTHNFSWVFNSPVDVVKLNIPDYFNVIKHPMDLGTVKSKLVGGEYSNPLGFATDVRLTFSNAMTYNPRGNDVHYMADTLSKNFETRWKSLERKFNFSVVVDSVPANSGTRMESDLPPLKKKKDMPVDDPLTESRLEKETMNDEEKHKLSMELESLLGELPDKIVDFLKEQSSGAEQTNEDEIEIDIDALGDDTLFELRRLLDDYLLEKQKTRTKSPCEPEVHNESGVSISLLPSSRGNNAIGEEVDIIGGNDLPLSSFPLVEIETDAGHRNDKCNSSSSSGSESGSSSNESDSGGSAGRADVAEVSRPVVSAKGEFTHGISEDVRHPLVKVDHESADLGPDIESSLPNLSSADADIHFEEENLPTERQVSPEKLYRAALLRSRFADTILKAREKALEKGEKLDPEKLRIEKEELERKAKEEKARIQAEAKAAEEARKRAEAKFAAEAKRKRDLERELARQALQKMEKTVIINENSEFMEDLEMLRVTQRDDAPNFLEEASPEISESHLGSFKLRSDSNPLEQLGLYMKMDYEEEEEDGEPSRNIYADAVEAQAKDILEDGEPSHSVEVKMRTRDIEEENLESIEVGVQPRDVEEDLEEREDLEKGVVDEMKGVDGGTVTEERKSVE
ncbi:hypothetical protein MLD38_032039 [Melastoma candidum]|uniref:Uncharacterized protein n=1 Tax=Melastoma candidum TaxID=119954 RepID=A0ACB9MS33_9MYRT|nr:hypothetical protein MLD38_032039 [Melastoma candidum]